jgi:hypothetical protein
MPGRGTYAAEDEALCGGSAGPDEGGVSWERTLCEGSCDETVRGDVLELGRKTNETIKERTLPKKPVIATIPISSSGARSIAKNAVKNIEKRMNQQKEKTTPFFLLNIFADLVLSITGTAPAFSRTSLVPVSGKPHCEQNIVSLDVCC